MACVHHVVDYSFFSPAAWELGALPVSSYSEAGHKFCGISIACGFAFCLYFPVLLIVFFSLFVTCLYSCRLCWPPHVYFETKEGYPSWERLVETESTCLRGGSVGGFSGFSQEPPGPSTTSNICKMIKDSWKEALLSRVTPLSVLERLYARL